MSEPYECLACPSFNNKVVFEDITFQYGAGKDAVMITAKCVPVYHCLDCSATWTDSVAETLKDDAVNRHFRKP